MAKLVKYLGSRSVKVDRLFKSRCVWQGNGDVQSVEDDELAEKMQRCAPDTYAIVSTRSMAKMQSEEETSPIENSFEHLYVEDENGETVSLGDATRATVAKYAEEELGMKIAPGNTKKEILGFIANYDELSDDSIKSNDVQDFTEEEPKDVPKAATREDLLIGICMEIGTKPTANTLTKAAQFDWSERVSAAERDSAWEKAQEILKETRPH